MIEEQWGGKSNWTPVTVNQHSPTLFGPLDRGFLAHIFSGHPEINPSIGKPMGTWVYAKSLPPVVRRSLLSRTYWIKRCKEPVQRELYRLASTDHGWNELRRILVSCEMRMNCLILANPNKPYEFFDGVNASLVSNSLNQKNFHKFLKSVVKRCRKAILTGSKPVVPRSCSWIAKSLKELEGKPEGLLRQLTLLQTRASGLPTKEIREDSLRDWISTVTNQEEPDMKLLEKLTELEDYMRKTMRVNAFTVKETHVSLGVSACLELPRSKGGKTAFARELIQTYRSCNQVSLETGEITSNLILADKEPGEFLFHYSLRKFLEEPGTLKRVRPSGVDEVGSKYRIITVASFYLYCVLSPWAHLTYQFLKTSRETKSGVSGTNHAWEMSLSLTASDPESEWLFRSQDPHAFNSDLKSATDETYHPAIEQMIDTIQAVMPVRNWYHEVVRELLSSKRPFSVKFEEEVINGISTRGCFMGDHGAKTILTLAGCYALAGMPDNRISRVVGDDQTTVAESRESAHECERVYRSRMESLGFKVSEDDTYVSPTVFFAEESCDIPREPDQTTEVWMSRKTRSRLNFHDIPKVKILSDAGKDLGQFSDLSIGKITLLGKRMEQTGKTYREGMFHLASWMQDICISLLFRKEFVYFPRFLVQTGKPPLFGSLENAKAFIKMHRRGRLLPYYGDIIRTASEHDLPHGKYIVQSFLTHGANDENLRITELAFDEEKFSEARVLTNLSVRGFEPFIIPRLGTKIISETEIVSKLAERKQLLGEKPPTSRLTVKDLARGTVQIGDEALTDFIKLWLSNSKLIRLRRTEKYYDRKAVEEMLGLTHPLRVSGILYPLPLEDKVQTLALEHDREVEKLYQWVLTNPQRLDDVPRALIRDDPVLCLSEHCLTTPRLLIVSDDMELVRASVNLRSFNWRQSRETFHISVEDWVLSDLSARRKSGGDMFEPNDVFIDEGSLDGYLDNLDHKGLDIPEPDGKTIEGRCRPLRPTGRIRLPQEMHDLRYLRTLESVPEDT